MDALKSPPVMTGAGWLYLAASGLLFYQSTRESDAGVRNLLILLASGLLALLVASSVAGWFNLRRLAIKRRLPAAVHVGEPLLLTVLVHNPRKATPACIVKIADDPVAGYALKEDSVTAVYTPAQGYSRLQTEASFLRRGEYTLERIRISSAFPLGLVTFKRTLPSRTQLVVYPRPLPLPGWLVDKLLSTGQSAGERVATRTGEDEVYGLREYRPGDNVRRIHWRTTARRGHPMLLEMEGRMDMRYRIIIDTYVAEQGPRSRADLEQLVSLAAGIAQKLFNLGMSAGICHHDGHRLAQVADARGAQAYHATMELLAGVGPSTRPLEGWFEEGLGAVPRGVLPVVLTLGHAAAAREFCTGARGGLVLSMQDLEVLALFATPMLSTRSTAERIALKAEG